MFVTIREDAFGEDNGLNSVGDRTQKCDRKIQEWRWRQINQ